MALRALLRRWRVIHELNHDLLLEENSVYHYAAQARVVRDGGLREKFEQFSHEEDIHVVLLEVMVKRLGGRVYPLRWLYRATGWVVGLVTALGGARFALGADAWLERGGYELYARHRRHALPLGDLVLVRQFDRLMREEQAHEEWLWQACRRARLRVVPGGREL